MTPCARGVLLLLGILFCVTTATLNVEEKQKEEIARESLKKLNEKGTADGQPEVPQNFEATAESSSIVMLSWDRPSSDDDVDHYLVFMKNEDEEGQDSTEDFFYLWQDLKPCTSYTFSVRAVSSTGDKSDLAKDDAQTLTGIPPESQNLHVEDFTFEDVTLAWEKPDTLCDITHYRVEYSEEGSTSNEIITSETIVTVTDLLPSTNYIFSVYASTSEGEGPVVSVEQLTSEDPGGPPKDLHAEGISSTAIKVSWSAPYKPPDHYEVKGIPCMLYMVSIYDDLFYVVEGLKPCTRCSFTVTSYYSESRKFSDTTSNLTQSGTPPPPTNCEVEVKKEYLAVKWKPPASSCPLGNYNVMWTSKKLWGDGEEESDTVNTPAISQFVFNPLPYHEYTFHIAASIQGTFGSPVSCSNTSLESLAGPAMLTSVVSDERGNALVTWNSPAEENGVITNYGIFVDDADDFSKEVSGDVHSATLTLESCNTYNFSVKALNNAGWGERSNMVEAIIVGDALPKELICSEPNTELVVCWEPFSTDCPVSQYNLKWEGDVLWSDTMTDMNSTRMDWSDTEICYAIPTTPYTEYTVELSVGKKLDQIITCSSITPMAIPGPPSLEELQLEELVISAAWKEPVEKNGIIGGYQVTWIDWKSDDEKYHLTNGSTFSYQIIESKCGGDVSVTVRAKTTEVEKFGDESQSRRVSLVSSISNLGCEATEPGEIEVAWRAEDSQCPVGEYHVTWTVSSLWSDDEDSGSRIVDGKKNSIILESLLSYSAVSVEVRVDSSEQGYACTATTLEGASSPPSDVHQTANDANSVTVAWSRPEAVRGELIGWCLKWLNLDNVLLDKHEINDSAIMTYQIMKLSSSKNYTVCVMAKNGAGCGKEECASVMTEYVSSESDLGLILGLSIGGAVVLIILAVGGYVLYTKNTKKKTPKSAPFMPEVIDLDKDNLYNKQHQSAASQRFQGRNGTVDFGTNRELYPDNGKAKDYLPEMDVDDGINNGSNTVPGHKSNLFGAPGDRRFSQQVSSSLPKQSAFNRRPSQVVNTKISSFQDYNRRSSHHDIPPIPMRGIHNKRYSEYEDVVKTNLGGIGRRSSQFMDIGRPNLKEFGRRPSQQIDIRPPNSADYRNRASHQIDQVRPKVDNGRRSSQQSDLRSPYMREYGRRPSQQIDIGRSRANEFARRPSQQIDGGGASLPSRSPQHPGPARPGYDHYKRRPTQQADIGMPINRAFMSRPSQQFMMNFDGIQE